MNYKGYTAHVTYDDEAKIFFGTVINTRDVITFEGTTVEEIECSFRESVDDYLAFCKELGQNPEKPFSGKFTLRIDPALHEVLYEKAIQAGKSLNRWVEDSLRTQAA